MQREAGWWPAVVAAGGRRSMWPAATVPRTRGNSGPLLCGAVVGGYLAGRPSRRRRAIERRWPQDSPVLSSIALASPSPSGSSDRASARAHATTGACLRPPSGRPTVPISLPTTILCSFPGGIRPANHANHGRPIRRAPAAGQTAIVDGVIQEWGVLPPLGSNADQGRADARPRTSSVPSRVRLMG
jgi:hypothetical protein